MRIWDIACGYLNDNSLLGEHRELHGIVSILENKKKGYSHHPETKRWQGCEGALRLRHLLIRSEMQLRGFQDRTPLASLDPGGLWPAVFITQPGQQFLLLEEKYRGKRQGRIPLPATVQELWAQHKYSILARDQQIYTSLGRLAATETGRATFDRIAVTLTSLIRVPPTDGGLRNALQHMWGHVSHFKTETITEDDLQNPTTLLAAVQKLAQENRIAYLLGSTALSELGAWLQQ